MLPKNVNSGLVIAHWSLTMCIFPGGCFAVCCITSVRHAKRKEVAVKASNQYATLQVPAAVGLAHAGLAEAHGQLKTVVQ